MYYGVVALLTRALRQDARQFRNHLFRLAFVGFIYLSLLIAGIQSFVLGAPGLRFFENIAWLNLFFITCAGIGFFSSAITEEKEEETIGLLQMAGLNHIGILLGKSTSRLIQVLLLLVVQFPFMLLAVTLGGVTTHQLFAAYVDMMAYTVLLANVALVCSVCFKRGGSAAGATTLLMILYAVVPGIASLGLRDLLASGWTKSEWWKSAILTTLEWLQSSSVFFEINSVLQTGFDQPILTKQVISNVVAGIFFFGLAWLLFGPCVQNADAGGDSRGAVLKSTSRVRFLSAGRAWINPLSWKDFHFIGGGTSHLIVKFMAYVGLLILIAAISQSPGNWLGLSLAEFPSVYFSIMLGALILEASILASRVFHDEIRLQTMSSLLMLPRSIPYIAYSKVAGCIIGLAPAAICLVAATLLLPDFQPRDLGNLLAEPAFWGVIMIVLVFLHLVALLSLFVKWGSLPLAFFLMGPISFCCPIWQVVFIFSQQVTNDFWGKLPATMTVWVLIGLICFVFQMMIAARLQELGTK
ncbi:hypothetical protein [Schlesneria sp. T3-172]|uniref:hypothetical protein n=1 Tax=Schlesneria sphaerica TaxID=3373610 RepID=UPI0037C6B4F3